MIPTHVIMASVQTHLRNPMGTRVLVMLAGRVPTVMKVSADLLVVIMLHGIAVSVLIS